MATQQEIESAFNDWRESGLHPSATAERRYQGDDSEWIVTCNECGMKFTAIPLRSGGYEFEPFASGDGSCFPDA